jgi:hypothetical protein
MSVFSFFTMHPEKLVFFCPEVKPSKFKIPLVIFFTLLNIAIFSVVIIGSVNLGSYIQDVYGEDSAIFENSRNIIRVFVIIMTALAAPVSLFFAVFFLKKLKLDKARPKLEVFSDTLIFSDFNESKSPEKIQIELSKAELIEQSEKEFCLQYLGKLHRIPASVEIGSLATALWKIRYIGLASKSRVQLLYLEVVDKKIAVCVKDCQSDQVNRCIFNP